MDVEEEVDYSLPKWLDTVKRNSRGVCMRVSNETDMPILVDNSEVTKGQLVEPLGAYIAPRRFIDIGMVSVGWMSGSEGEVGVGCKSFCLFVSCFAHNHLRNCCACAGDASQRHD
jgi:hypothetical protein